MPLRRKLIGRKLILGLLALSLLLAGGMGMRLQAKAKSQGQSGRADWSYLLPDKVDAVDACLAHVQQPAAILKAWAMKEGQLTIRLREAADGERWDCLVHGDGSMVENLELVPGASPPQPGEGKPVFYRAKDNNTPPSCHSPRSIRDREGNLVGWLTDGLCP